MGVEKEISKLVNMEIDKRVYCHEIYKKSKKYLDGHFASRINQCRNETEVAALEQLKRDIGFELLEKIGEMLINDDNYLRKIEE